MEIKDHAFIQGMSYPEGEGCAYIIEGSGWTIADPVRCRRPKTEHPEPPARKE